MWPCLSQINLLYKVVVKTFQRVESLDFTGLIEQALYTNRLCVYLLNKLFLSMCVYVGVCVYKLEHILVSVTSYPFRK